MRPIIAGCLLLLLTACSTHPLSQGRAFQVTKASYSDLPGLTDLLQKDLLPDLPGLRD